MNELKLIDRVVVEIKSEGEPFPTDIANQLRLIALEIEEGYSGRSRSYQNGCECLWQHETPECGGFRMGNKSLICQYYYGSEPKPDKYIIIAHNYDRENSDAYPVDGRLFASEEEAKAYLRDHIDSIKSNHWTATRVDGEDRYSEEFTFAGWHAEDWNDGSSLELTITQVTEE